MQTLRVEAGSKPPSIVSVIRASTAQSGLRNLYVGLSASILRQMSYSLVRLGSYEKMKARISQDGHPSAVRLLVAASIAGGLGGISGNPAGM